LPPENTKTTINAEIAEIAEFERRLAEKNDDRAKRKAVIAQN
jgi:hypothetical protein